MFYSDTSVRTQLSVNVWRMDGTKHYLTHYSNLLILAFMAQTGSRIERADLEKEIVIGERKLAFWRKHPLYDHDLALKGIATLKQEWAQSRGQ